MAMVTGGGGGTGAKSQVPGSSFNPRSLWSNFKSTDWGGFTHSAGTTTYGTEDLTGNNDFSSTTTTGGISGMHGAGGAAVFAGGMMLAQHGLLGNDMGTGTGAAEGAVGGAAAGFAAGGPLGAAIGGVAGLGIGLGEMAAGVQSPEAKVVKDVQSVYGVSLPLNSGTVKQVVQIAQSQYGGDIAVAVRSPSVRQIIMLYSEATGQKMPLSASTPYAGSLVEQGGNLYQQASFQNNAWHTYASNIPTLAGITSAPYPTQAGPNTSGGTGVNLALNINGTAITSQYVMDQSVAAQDSSYGRTQQAANLQVPGLMVA
jgi:hypothetical protein